MLDEGGHPGGLIDAPQVVRGAQLVLAGAAVEIAVVAEGQPLDVGDPDAVRVKHIGHLGGAAVGPVDGDQGGLAAVGVDHRVHGAVAGIDGDIVHIREAVHRLDLHEIHRVGGIQGIREGAKDDAPRRRIDLDQLVWLAQAAGAVRPPQLAAEGIEVEAIHVGDDLGGQNSSDSTLTGAEGIAHGSERTSGQIQGAQSPFVRNLV